ncbi:MAG: porin [Geobacteraceae bacterium]|nr:porin [Geobacteraceae bacterium]
MKKSLVAVIAALGACFMAVQGAEAKTLEDILKEKGVITEADYKEVTKVKPFDYKLGKGFTFTSQDEKFSLSVGGRMQFRYTFTDQDNAQDSSTFDAKRIRLIFQGYAYSKDLTYKLELDARQLASSTTSGGLLDAYLNYKLMDEVQILVGQTKAKFSRSYLISDGALMFVDRAPFVTKLVPGYDIGAIVHGDIAKGLIEYNLAASNGAGQTQASSDNDNMFSTRVVFNPFGVMSNDEPDLAISKKPLLSIGANYLYTKSSWSGTTTLTSDSKLGFAGQSQFKPSAASKNEFNNYGVDAEFKWMGVSIQAEGVFAQAENSLTNATTRSVGYYGQAGYMITPELGLALRYSVYDPDRNKGNDLQTEQIGAVSYYFSKHNLKLQGDVANLHTQTTTAKKDDMQYRIQAQIIF